MAHRFAGFTDAGSDESDVEGLEVRPGVGGPLVQVDGDNFFPDDDGDINRQVVECIKRGDSELGVLGKGPGPTPSASGELGETMLEDDDSAATTPASISGIQVDVHTISKVRSRAVFSDDSLSSSLGMLSPISHTAHGGAVQPRHLAFGTSGELADDVCNGNPHPGPELGGDSLQQSDLAEADDAAAAAVKGGGGQRNDDAEREQSEEDNDDDDDDDDFGFGTIDGEQLQVLAAPRSPRRILKEGGD